MATLSYSLKASISAVILNIHLTEFFAPSHLIGFDNTLHLMTAGIIVVKL